MKKHLKMTKGLILTMGIVASMFSLLTGCDKNKDPNSPDAPSPAATEKVAPCAETLKSVSYSCSHMNYYECFSFEMYTFNGKVLFRASCANPDKDGNRLTIEEKEVTPEDLRAAGEILDKYDSYNFLRTYKKPITVFHASDETTHSFSASWQGTNIMTANSTNKCGSELRAFFVELAKKYSK